MRNRIVRVVGMLALLTTVGVMSSVASYMVRTIGDENSVVVDMFEFRGCSVSTGNSPIADTLLALFAIALFYWAVMIKTGWDSDHTDSNNKKNSTGLSHYVARAIFRNGWR